MRFAITLLIAVVALSPTARAEPEPERLYNDGQRAYDAGRFDDALAAWQKSYALSKLPGLLFNIAQAYRLRAWSGDCTKAIDAYRRFIAVDPRSELRGAAEGFLAELSTCAETEHASAPHEPAKPVPEPVDHGRGKRLASYALGGGSVVLLGIGVYFQHQASTLAGEVTASCAHGCTFSDVAAKDADGRSAGRKAPVFYGLGGAGLIAAGVLYWVASRERSPVVVAPRGDGATVSWIGSW
jgi:tetratricopeptide (TPR) repeat protein